MVTVVIPCYNSKQTIGSCLNALEVQTYPREQFEIVVADNGSSDGSLAFLAQEFPGVRVVHATEKGSAYARNAGIAVAAGKFIVSTDADCVAESGWMQTLVETLEAAPPDTAAVAGNIVPFSTSTLVEKYPLSWVQQPDFTKPDAKIRYAATPSAIFRADRVREIGGFRGTAGHDDADMGIRLEAAGYRILYTDKAVVRHRNPVTLSELYKHRVKYGISNFVMAKQMPHLLGDPATPGALQSLRTQTWRRVIGDVVKLPLSLLHHPEGRPLGWPMVDAVIAVGNYRGYARGYALDKITSSSKIC